MKYSPAPIVLGLILGQMVDFRFRNALRVANGNVATFVQRPISCIFLILIIFTVIFQARSNKKRRKAEATASAAEAAAEVSEEE